MRLAAFTPERLRDVDVQALMQKVDVTIDPECDAGFPGARAARVTVELLDGRRFAHFQPTRKGDPEMPLTDAELEAKFLELAAPVIGAAAAASLHAQLCTIDQRSDVLLTPITLALAAE